MMLSGAPDHHRALDAHRDIKKVLTYSTGGDNAPDRASKGRRGRTSGYGTGRARDSSDEEEDRGRRKSTAPRTSSKKKEKADETPDRARKKTPGCHPHEKVYRHSTVVRRRRPIRGSGGARHRNCPSTSDTGYQLARHLEQIDRRLQEMQKDHPNTGPLSDKTAPAGTTGAPNAEHRPPPDKWSAKDRRPLQHRSAQATTEPTRPACADGIVCYGCGKPGHIRRYCDQPSPGKTTPAGHAKVAHGADQADVYLAMEIQGRRVPCLLDTGCDVTMVPRDVAGKVTNLEIRPTKHRM